MRTHEINLPENLDLGILSGDLFVFTSWKVRLRFILCFGCYEIQTPDCEMKCFSRMWDDLYFVNWPKLWPQFIFSALFLLSILLFSLPYFLSYWTMGTLKLMRSFLMFNNILQICHLLHIKVCETLSADPSEKLWWAGLKDREFN